MAPAIATPSQLMRRALFVWCGLLIIPLAAAESVFPLAKEKFPQAAGQLPYGIGLGWYQQKQDYALERLTFAVPGGFPAAGGLTAENESQFTQVRPQLWLLPFLEVYGIFGRVK